MKKRAKGFTLIELIIVIAIMGVLMAILIPSWMNYIRNSRIKTQNNNSKVVFDAAQQVLQEYKFMERHSNADASLQVTGGEFFLYWNGNAATATGVDNNGNAVAKDASLGTELAEEINKVYSNGDETCYRIYVRDYLVQSVVCARYDGDDFMGSYPVPREDLTTTMNVSTFQMLNIDNDTTNDVT